MQIKKQNFIEQMKSRLNAFHLQKIKTIQLRPQYQQLFIEQNKAKDALIQLQDDPSQQASFITNELQDIKGWSSNRARFQERIGSQKYNFKKNLFRPNQSKGIESANLYNQRNPNTIPYLKNILEKLQSPKGRKQIKTQKKNRNIHKQVQKNKTQQNTFHLKKSRMELKTIECQKHHHDKSQKKPQRAKFQTIDLNTENRPFPMQMMKNPDYQKIKRKNPSQYQIDIAHEKGNSKDQNNYFSQRHSLQKVSNNKKGPQSNQKFTLKNLLY